MPDPTPVDTSPEGVTRKPRYLYSLTEVMVIFLIFILHLICRPVLLKTMHLDFSTLIFSQFFAEKSDRSCSISVNPSLLSDTITRSSAHRMQLSGSFGPIFDGLFLGLLRISGKSDIKNIE